MNILHKTLVAGGLAMSAVCTASAAEDWPQKPIRLVVPFAPGGSTDVTARLVADKLTAELEQQVAVDNVPGAGGMVGAAEVAAAPADGYTVLFGTSTMSTLQVFFKEPSVDTLKDFIPTSLVSQGVTSLIVNQQVRVNSVAEFIEKARINPASISFGTPGQGTASLTMEMMKHRAGLEVEVVHYRGAGPAMTALLSNEIQAMFEPTLTAKPVVDGGQAKVLATTGLERSPVFPDAPTLTEALGEKFDGSFYNGVFLKAGTSDVIVQKLQSAVKTVVDLPDVKQKLTELGQIPVGSSPEAFRQKLEAEIPQWIGVGKVAGVEPH